MARGKKPPQELRAELGKMAKLSSMEHGLPLMIRFLPAAAIAAGEIYAKTTNGRNSIKERLIGDDDVVALASPAHQDVASHQSHLGAGSQARTGGGSAGAQRLCVLCSYEHVRWRPFKAYIGVYDGDGNSTQKVWAGGPLVQAGSLLRVGRARTASTEQGKNR